MTLSTTFRKRLALAILSTLVLAGCGNKGPLFRPPAKPIQAPTQAPAVPSTTTAPADIEIPVDPPIGTEAQPAEPPTDDAGETPEGGS